MTEGLILMERLEARENKDIIKADTCAMVGVILCVSLGVNWGNAVREFMEHPPAVLPGSVKEVCGYCSIQ